MHGLRKYSIYYIFHEVNTTMLTRTIFDNLGERSDEVAKSVFQLTDVPAKATARKKIERRN